MLLLLYRSSRPHVAELGQSPDGGRFDDLDRHPESRRVPGVVVLRVESGLFFANAEAVQMRVREVASAEGTKAVVLDAETVSFIDVSAVRMLDQLAEDLERDGMRLLLARDIGQVRDVLREADAGEPLRRVYPSVREAVAAAQQST